MPRALNLIGHLFTRLTVLSEAPRTADNRRRYLCQCTCGKQVVVVSGSLRSRTTRSCGCLVLETNTKHGHAVRGKSSREYHSWTMMLGRCYNPKNPSYKYYGARGIAVTERWHHFANFLADMGS